MGQDMIRNFLIGSLLGLAFCAPALAAEDHYTLDPDHTFPSFEADHMGISVWRGKFNHSTGKVAIDREAKTGTVEVSVDVSSADFGQDALNEHMQKPEMFDGMKYPKATYKGKLAGFENGAPTQVIGDFTFRGVTKPLELKISKFKCIPHPMLKKELCGADASATFKRDDYGLDAGKDYGFDMSVNLRIQVEALKDS
jgi:polyisoprenoid-binding protein YceI